MTDALIRLAYMDALRRTTLRHAKRGVWLGVAAVLLWLGQLWMVFTSGQVCLQVVGVVGLLFAIGITAVNARMAWTFRNRSRPMEGRHAARA